MAAVKSLVIFMGVLIIAGLGLLGYGMMRTSDDMAAQESGQTRRFGTLELAQPSGSGLRAVIPDGTGRLLLSVTGGGQADRVVVVDLRDGTVLGTVTVGAAGGSQ